MALSDFLERASFKRFRDIMKQMNLQPLAEYPLASLLASMAPRATMYNDLRSRRTSRGVALPLSFGYRQTPWVCSLAHQFWIGSIA
jgi:hypothetical protein